MTPFLLTGSIAASRIIAGLIQSAIPVSEINRTILYRIYWYIRDERKAETL